VSPLRHCQKAAAWSHVRPEAVSNATHTDSPTGMSRRLTVMFAVAAGAAVANLYWAQPLLGYIADSLEVSTGTAGLLITVSQIGYAIGVFLLVPLGDSVSRKRLIPLIMVLSAAALGLSTLASNFAVLVAAMALIGVSTVSAQLLAPLAGDLAGDEQRGQVVGTVASGVVTGILLSRTISGIVADTLGWRAIFGAACCATLVLAAILARALPSMPSRTPLPYRQLLRSVFSSVATTPAVQVTMGIGAGAMAVFTLFWTALTFYLSADPFNYSATRIGLVGIIGLVGALSAQSVGKLYNRGLSVTGIGVALGSVVVALAISALGSRSVIFVLIGVALLCTATQCINILCQTRMLSLDPSARSRLNTAFVVANFVGGALGSSLAGLLWHVGQWPAVVAAGAVIVSGAMLLWFIQRNRALSE
jgi:predicted MFS family arabinose efflux permease